ncbi:MAG: amino acid ABC transporter permease [Janthinobacterium sp.]|uniref:amino acid ABC transporter permease n=1 Tax=Janthinobacterium sp. HH106 TaxID=1537278 RepID=UPI0008737477|nr:amino acid ABC transporter permease [Janthinobacterium sp. HH106]OEZ82553.1 inner membrane amino-acid ABC transporter permease protein YecS [Janthinobacterium sp. HH106]
MPYEFHFELVMQSLDRLLWGAALTIRLSAMAMVLGLAVGVCAAVILKNGPAYARAVVRAYVEIIRSTPFLVQLFIIYFGLPSLGLQLDANGAALVAMTVNLGAYAAEIVRAGIGAVHPSQLEAAQALGMTRWQVMRHVVLLPALEKVYPALASQFTLMMLASSVVSAISAEELTAAAHLLDAETFRSFEIYIVVMVLYILLALLFRFGFWVLGQIVFKRRRRLGAARMGA